MNFYPSIKFRLNNYTFFIKELEFGKNCKKKISTKNSNYLKHKKDKKGLYFTKKNSKDMIIVKRVQFSKF